ncbi:MAG: oligosaccharide flippase family protein [Erythrobacter sp.]|uniref:oligosaccharide flippase family protein n=1 Tax=Erythrobacter sp. TaxID=1042 RepID=UPI003C76B88D
MSDRPETFSAAIGAATLRSRAAQLYGFALSSRVEMAAIAIKLTSAFFSFLIVFLVARTSGAAVTGNYALAIATATLLSLIAVLGLDQIVTRAIGGDLREDRPDLARAALNAAVRRVAPVAMFLALATYFAAPLATYIAAPPDAIRAIAVAVIAFPLLKLAVVSLRASGSVFWSQLFDGAHSLILIGILASLLLFSDVPINSVLVASMYSVAVATSMAAAWLMLRFRTRDWPKGARNASPMLSRSWPILAAGVGHAFVNWFVLAYVGAVLSSADVGAFRVAFQVVMLIAMMTTTIEALVNPQLAGDFRIKDIDGAWRRHRRMTLVMLLVSAPPVAICLILPEPVLTLFGPEFTIATTALVVLAAGQLANVLTGPIGGVMIMSGHERLSLVLSITGLVVAVGLSVALTPVFGLVGAATAAAGAIVTRNLAAYVIMRRKLVGSQNPAHS